MDSPDVKKNKGISKDQWLVKALELLVSNGFEAVKTCQVVGHLPKRVLLALQEPTRPVAAPA